MTQKSTRILTLTLLLVVFGATQAFAGPKITVDDDGQQCPNAQFTTIQAAVNAAASGTEIVVCQGTYTEQVTIPSGKNNLTLRSDKPLAAIIKAPASMSDPKAIVRVAGAQNTTLRGFTITGPGGGGCDSIRWGVRVDGGGSATIRDNHITEIRDNPFSGCQNGIGILVGRLFEGQTGTATIRKNLIDNYQKGGIVVDNVGSSADIKDNDVTGVGPTALIAQNGIQVSRGATANVQKNDISQNVYTPQTVVSTGILLFEPGSVTVEHNEASSNDVNIYAFNSPGPVIRHNKVSGGAFDGIALTGETTGADVSHNTSLNNGFDGIFVDETSTGNSITHNKMHGNAVFDAEDLSVGGGSCGTANTWEHNDCDTDNKFGCLCGHDESSGAEDSETFTPAQRPNTPVNDGGRRVTVPSP